MVQGRTGHTCTTQLDPAGGLEVVVAGGVAGAGWAPGYMHNGRGRLLRDTATSYEDLLAQVGAEH